MTLLSAYQDFVSRTLSALDTAMERLRYIAGLRDGDGRYQHWGLARVHGDAAAQDAIQRAHRATLLEVLRTPVRDLFTQESKVAAKQYKDVDLLPRGSSKAAAAHFSSTVLALSVLERARAESTHQVA